MSRRFAFVEVPEQGSPRTVPGAPYLDYRPGTDDELARLGDVRDRSWLAAGVETVGLDHAIEVAVPEHLATVRAHTVDRVERTRAAVRERLTREINFWDQRANELRLQADSGRTPRMNPDRAAQRADEMARRLEQRMRTLDQEQALQPLPPTLVGAALVVPRGLLDRLAGTRTTTPETFARNTAEVERRAVEAPPGPGRGEPVRARSRPGALPPPALRRRHRHPLRRDQPELRLVEDVGRRHRPGVNRLTRRRRAARARAVGRRAQRCRPAGAP